MKQGSPEAASPRNHLESRTTSRARGAGLRSLIGDHYLPLMALSAYSGLSVRTLRSHLAGREWPLPFYRIGGKILVRRSDFDMWAAHFRRDAAGVDALVDDILQGLE